MKKTGHLYLWNNFQESLTEINMEFLLEPVLLDQTTCYHCHKPIDIKDALMVDGAEDLNLDGKPFCSEDCIWTSGVEL